MIRPLSAVLALATAVAGCTPLPSTQESRRSAADLVACRQRADEAYGAQNRQDVYAADSYVGSLRDAPFASSGLPGITTNGLGGRHQRDVLLADCLNAGSAPGPTPPVPAPE